MILKHNDVEIELQFNTYGLNVLAELNGKNHPFELFDDGFYLAKYKNHISVIQAGISGATFEEVSKQDACKVIDSLGGIQNIEWEKVYSEAIEKANPKEITTILDKFKSDKKKAPKAVKSTGRTRSSQPSK